MRGLRPIATLLLLASGCATTSGSTSDGPRPSLAVLPVESDVSQKIVSALNDALQAVKIEGNIEVRRLKVAMQVVQMQIECIEVTDACFTAVGKSLNVNGFLTATLSKDKAKGYRVILVLFNVDKGTTIKVVDKSFKKEDEAVRSAYELVDEVLKRKADADEGSH